MDIAITTNEKKKKTHKKKQDLVVMENLIYCAIDFQEFYILLYKYSLDQAKNVLPVTKWRH